MTSTLLRTILIPAGRRPRLDAWIAFVAVLTLPLSALGAFGIAGLTPGFIIALATVPVWIRAAYDFIGATTVQIGAVAVLAGGYALSIFDRGMHDIDPNRQVGLSTLLLALPVCLGLLLWARERIGIRATAIAYGLGVLANNLGTAGDFTEDSWKFVFAWPICVILTAFAIGRHERRWLLAFVPVLIVASAIGSYRSLVVFLLSSVALYFAVNGYRTARRTLSRETALLRLVSLFVVVPACAYALISYLLLSGILGETAKTRTQEELASAGNLLAGGRIEWSATLQLFLHRPGGYGLGLMPNTDDVLIAKDALASIGADTGSRYVNQEMFGSAFKLHSFAGDFWVNSGLVGIAFVAMLTILLIRYIYVSIRTGGTTYLQLLLFAWSFWDVLFSPAYTNIPLFTFALALLLVRRRRTPFELSMNRSSSK